MSQMQEHMENTMGLGFRVEGLGFRIEMKSNGNYYLGFRV